MNLILRVSSRRHASKLEIGDFRRIAARIDRRFAHEPRRLEVEDRELGGLPTRFIRPVGGEVRGTLFVLHGGAWCIETPNLHSGLAGRLAVELGFEAVLPSYRLAPEHPFPAGLEDCITAWRAWTEAGGVPRRCVLVGDSAGGALALALMGELRNGGAEQPGCALLLSPATDLTSMGRSVVDNERSDVMFGIAALMLMRHWYLGEHNPTDPRASPYWGDFTGFPPLLFQVSGSEMLLDSSRLASAKARRQGVTTQLSVWPGMPHDFTLFGFLPEARAGIREQIRFIREHLPDGT
ncbi:alpha/beta hydrolase [Elongatibacter sediminis]|uniref:Alpha/beta hydrolase n=1 Tax=Elongatibacter sediminis TaxID=3119006 RepID=A0AAW9RNH2_9GAMM